MSDTEGLPDAPEPEVVTVACEVTDCDERMPETDTFTAWKSDFILTTGYSTYRVTVCKNCYHGSWKCPRCMKQFVESYSDKNYIKIANEHWCVSCTTDGAHYCDECDSFVANYIPTTKFERGVKL